MRKNYYDNGSMSEQQYFGSQFPDSNKQFMLDGGNSISLQNFIADGKRDLGKVIKNQEKLLTAQQQNQHQQQNQQQQQETTQHSQATHSKKEKENKSLFGQFCDFMYGVLNNWIVQYLLCIAVVICSIVYLRKKKSDVGVVEQKSVKESESSGLKSAIDAAKLATLKIE